MTDGTLHGFDEHGSAVSTRARLLDTDANGRKYVETFEQFIPLPTREYPDAHLFEPGEPRWLHPRMFTFEPDEEATHG